MAGIRAEPRAGDGTLKQECEEKVAFLEDDRKRADQVHNLEMNHMKQQLQAKIGERKELLALLV